MASKEREVNWILRIALASPGAIATLSEGQAQMNAVALNAMQYFLNQPPTDADLAKLQVPARNLTVVKACIIDRVFWRGARHLSEEPRPKTKLGAKIKILEVLRGDAAIGAQYVVYFGPRDLERPYSYPRTPSMHEPTYFLVFYLDKDEDDERQLVGFPLDWLEYEQWNREFWEYEGKKFGPGAR
jgi:hypothetical protein